MASSFEQSTTKTPKKQKIRTVIRNAKEQEWANISVIPDKGELVYASDVNTLKIGDGVTVYDNLPAISGGEQGTTDYTDLTNKPQINGVTLVGNVSLSNLGLANVASTGEYSDLINTPVLGTMAAENASDYTKTSSLSNVALSGSYDDLVNKPNFGTAAYANTTDFATAAQGDLANTAVQPTDLANVATTGNYNDLTNKPTIPAAQVNADWNASSGVAEILNKPNLANVATTGSYDDLTNKPYIPAGVVVDLTYDPLSTNAAAGTAVAEAVANKQDTLINGTNIKSINGNTLLGSGNLVLDGLPDQTGNSGKYLTTNGTTASWNNLANVAISGSYDDLVNTPVLGSMAYANTSDYTTTANLSNVALSGEYSDLVNTPVIPTVDQVYNSLSSNAQSGTAVSEAVSTKSNVVLRDWSV